MKLLTEVFDFDLVPGLYRVKNVDRQVYFQVINHVFWLGYLRIHVQIYQAVRDEIKGGMK